MAALSQAKYTQGILGSVVGGNSVVNASVVGLSGRVGLVALSSSVVLNPVGRVGLILSSSWVTLVAVSMVVGSTVGGGSKSGVEKNQKDLRQNHGNLWTAR